MNPASVDIANILAAYPIFGLTFATNLFVGKEPDTPDNCVTIFDTPGEPPERLLTKVPTFVWRPSIQIRVRDTSYIAGWFLINQIQSTLHNRGPEIRNDTRYLTMFCEQEAALLDWDENNRVRFVTTFGLQRVLSN